MRSGASVSQLLAESSGPRPARMMRALSRRVGIAFWCLPAGTSCADEARMGGRNRYAIAPDGRDQTASAARKGEAVFEHGAQRLLDRLGEIGVPRRRVVFVGKIAAHRQFHLHGMDAVGRT